MARPIEIINKFGNKIVYEVLLHYFASQELGTAKEKAGALDIDIRDYWTIVSLGKRWKKEGKKEQLIKILQGVPNEQA